MYTCAIKIENNSLKKIFKVSVLNQRLVHCLVFEKQWGNFIKLSCLVYFEAFKEKFLVSKSL